MITAIFAALNEGAPNMLLTLLLISLLVIWLQSKFNKEFGSLHKDFEILRKEIADGNKALHKEIADGNAALRKEIAEGDTASRKEAAEGFAALRKDIGKVSARVARIEGMLGPPAPVPKTQSSAEAG